MVLPRLLLPLIIFCPLSGPVCAEEKPITPRFFSFTKETATTALVAGALAEQTGMEIDISALDHGRSIKTVFVKNSFWEAVDALAEQTGSRVHIGRMGKAVSLSPLNDGVRSPVWRDGPFRIVAKDVDARINLESGKTSYDLTLEVAWESRLPVLRADTLPRITKGEDDAGKPITASPISARASIAGNHAILRVPLNGLSRESKQIALLRGELTVTAAEEMLRFKFDDVTKPARLKMKGVEVVLKRFVKEGAFWIADVQVLDPDSQATFESFETYRWSRNRLTLFAPDGKQKWTNDDPEEIGLLRYRFKESKDFKPESLKGWTVEYETPGSLREVPVQFELKGIRLP